MNKKNKAIKSKRAPRKPVITMDGKLIYRAVEPYIMDALMRAVQSAKRKEGL